MSEPTSNPNEVLNSLVGGRQVNWNRSSVFGVPIALNFTTWAGFSAVSVSGRSPEATIALLVFALLLTTASLCCWAVCLWKRPDLLRNDKIQAIQVACESGLFGNQRTGPIAVKESPMTSSKTISVEAILPLPDGPAASGDSNASPPAVTEISE